MTTSQQTTGASKLVTSLFTSLDGIVEADEQWQFAYFDEELFAGIAASWARAGAVLMGRRSFEGYDRLRREHPDSPAVQFLEATPRYVASTTVTEVAWAGTTVLGADLHARIAGLRARHEGVLVLGSPTLVRWLIARGLLDVLALTVLPVLVGSGVRLFTDMDLPGGPRGMRLAASRPLASGVLELEYTFA